MKALLQQEYFTTGTINLLGGGPYSGKTTLLRTLLKAATEGKDFFGLETIPPTSWCHVVSDREQQVFLDDCKALGLELPTTSHLWQSVDSSKKKQHAFAYQQKGHAYAREWLGKQMEDWAREGKLRPGGLITLDTAMPFVPDAKSYADSWVASQELRDLAKTYDVVLLLICHAGKFKPMQSAATPWERIQVSMALIGCTDTTLYICSPLETQQTKFDNVQLEPDSQLITMKGRQADSHYWTGKIRHEAGTTVFDKLGDVGPSQASHDNPDWGGARVGAGRPPKITSEQVREIVDTMMGDSSQAAVIQKLMSHFEVTEMTARAAIKRAMKSIPELQIALG